ncbi:MAG: hypothetical protein LBR23_07450 [Spirochaetaceae bacterium]|jgi:predicted RNA-binding Zn-ribbon protein involved in translation (DUF1610 family)|nr:hypothetical protein [Spirochaetaceae bacterium]
MADIQDYKCPNCNGAVQFDSSIQKMKCPYCEAEFEIAALMEYQAQQETPGGDAYEWGEAGSGWDQAEADELAANACPSCGAEIIGDKNTAATVCPYCGNTQIVRKRFEGMLKPDYVLPFKVDKKAAKAALENFYRGKKLLPGSFKTQNHIDSIQGIYVPFWLFDARAEARIRYKAEKSKSWSDSANNYTKTDYFSVTRGGTLDFQKIPVDGSAKMDDAYMDAIEPFDYGALTEFQTAYLSGYLAEKYDVDAAESVVRAEARVKETVVREFARTVQGYGKVTAESVSISVKQGSVSYALFPVWMLGTRYKGKDYLFAMNGQTGRLVGELPVDSVRVWKWLGILTAAVGLAVTAIVRIAAILV